MKMPEAVAARAQQAIDVLKAGKLSVTTAESCTGGLIAGALTSISGSSDAVYGGFITYANTAKTAMIGVPARLIRDFGAVSSQVARAMADGARSKAHSDIGIAVTGIAGPQGGSEKKPVGLVYISCATHEGTRVAEHRFAAKLGRDGIREATVLAAIEMLTDVAQNGVAESRPDPKEKPKPVMLEPKLKAKAT